MELSSQQLGRIAGICLTAAGAIFVGVQVNHPAITLEFIGSTEFVVRQVLKVAMTVLALPAMRIVSVGRAAEGSGPDLLAAAVATLALGLVPYAFFLLLARAFYALGDSPKTTEPSTASSENKDRRG